MLFKSSLPFVGLVSFVSSLAVNNVSIATPVSNHRALFGLSPTPAPALEELRRREATQVTQQTLLAAPDNTCGYFNGSSSSPWGVHLGTMSLPLRLPYRTAPNPLQETCYAVIPRLVAQRSHLQRHASIVTGMTGSCPEDPMTLKWYQSRLSLHPLYSNGWVIQRELFNRTSFSTSGIYVFCNTITFTTPDVSAFFSNYISTYVPLPAETTFAPQIGHNFTTTIAKFATTPGPSTSLSSASAKSSSTGSYGASASTTVASSSGAKTTNKKAIIGGVVGGLLGLALIIGAVFMFVRSRTMREPAVELKAAASSSEAIGVPAEPEGTSKTVMTAYPK